MTDFQNDFQRIKLHRPRTIPGAIERTRLHAQLNQVLEKPLAIISAPAGFGKTTLLTQWLQSCPIPNIWLQLDKNDHEIPTFVFGLINALRQIFPDCLKKTADLGQAQRSVPLDIWVAALITDLEILTETPFVLALDDYHLINNPYIDLLLAKVLQFDPSPLRLILSARHDPAISFSRLEVQNKIIRITSADLRFTNVEAQAYLARTDHMPLSDSDIHQLNQKTEGWAAGLTLVAIKLRDEIQPQEIISRLEGSDRLFSDYLLNQVFNLQPQEIQEFLLKTAIFSQFCAQMLADVFGPEQSQSELQVLIERIEDAQLFLIPLDGQRTWFRYHHLFRQMLLGRQRIAYPSDQITPFHQRAADWLVQHGHEEEALQHLLAIKDWLVAAQLVESQAMVLLNHEDYLAIRRYMAHFPEEFINTRPGLLLIQGWIAHLSFQFNKIQLLTGKMQTLLAAVPDHRNPQESNELLPGFEEISSEVVQAQTWALESLCFYITNQSKEALPLARQALDTLPETWMFVRGNVMIYMGLSMCMEGQYQQMVTLFKQIYKSIQEPATAYGERLLFTIAVGHLLHGDLELCRQTAEQMIHDAEYANLLLIKGWGHYLLGRVYQEWNQLEEAASQYYQVIEQRFTSNLYCALDSILCFIFIQQTLGNHELAQQTLSLLQNQDTNAPQPVMGLSAWIKLQHGKQIEARRWADSFTRSVAHEPITWWGIPYIFKLNILMETGESSGNLSVTQLMDEVITLAERTRNNHTLLRLLAMKAVWLARQGKFTTAQESLMRALHLGRPGGFIHSFVIHGPEMLKLLQLASSQMQDKPVMQAYLETIMTAFTSTADGQPARANHTEMITMLTAREHDVLKLLAERMSIKEISDRLCISPSTVQQHTHHIYRKLNVANKRQAVARAIELGILPEGR